MTTEPQHNTEQNSNAGGSSSSSNILLIVLAGGLFLALVAIGFLLIFYVFGDSGSGGDSGGESGGGSGEIPTLPVPGVTVEATIAPPTPEVGEPTGTVIAPLGVNVRVGPGTQYPSLGVAPQGTVFEVVGVSVDGTWYVMSVPGAPNGQGWVSAEFLSVENVENVPVIQPPPTPTPVATPTATATPAPEVTFTASRTVINAGETSVLAWLVENVRAVYLYPVGARFENYPVTGEGTQEVQPYITTSYELLVFNVDGTTSAQRIEITVVNGLTSGRWLLQSYSTPETGLRTVLQGTQITARFGADGSLNGSAGCNTYSGGFAAYDQTLRISALSSSQILCSDPSGIMEQEGLFLSLMHQSSTMAISAGQLSIFDSVGSRILVFNQG